MALDAVDELSDDGKTVALSPSAGVREAEKQKAKEAKKQTEPKKKEPKEKKVTPKAKAEPATKAAVKQSAKPKAVKPKPGVLQRPAAASPSSGPGILKKPAAEPTGDKVSAGKSQYKSNGIWCIKLNGKEVVRAFRLQLVCE